MLSIIKNKKWDTIKCLKSMTNQGHVTHATYFNVIWKEKKVSKN